MVRLNIKLKGDRGGITHILYNRKMKYNEKKINPLSANLTIYFSIWVFFHNHSRITGLQGKGEGISLTPHYHFHPLHKHLDNSRAITAESSPLHIGSRRTRTGKPLVHALATRPWRNIQVVIFWRQIIWVCLSILWGWRLKG